MTMSQSTTIKLSMIEQWKTSFLGARDLSAPTGAPLYTYRATEGEFEDLGTVLRGHLGARLRFSSLAQVSRRDAWFSALFVLYSAEWWRRRYDGSGWSWDPIVRGIGIAAENWTQSQRSECVEAGLAQWGIPLSESRGLRYLGSIALQGGLPMQLLAAAHGNIGRVLTRVLQLALQRARSAIQLCQLEWVLEARKEQPSLGRLQFLHDAVGQMKDEVLSLEQC
jgi:hypothetical protein